MHTNRQMQDKVIHTSHPAKGRQHNEDVNSTRYVFLKLHSKIEYTNSNNTMR